MFKIFIISILLMGSIYSANCAIAQNYNYTIRINSDSSLKTYKAFLFYKNGSGNIRTDSTSYSDGGFTLKGTVPNTQKAVLYVAKGNSGFGFGQNSKPGMSVYLEEGTITISGPLTYEEARRSGTQLNRDYQVYLDIVRPIYKKEQELLKQSEAALNQGKTKRLEKVQNSIFDLIKKKNISEENFFKTHTSSLVAFDWLESNINLQQEKTRGLQLFDLLDPSLKNSIRGMNFKRKLSEAQSVEVGSIAPDFHVKTIDGESWQLSDSRGKYILLDFWASWCLPCRKEHPNLIKIAKDNLNKNFEIIGFSFDKTEVDWRKAIQQDKLTWTQVSDLLAFNSPIASLYGITSIPSNVLIDPKGKIIARDLKGDDLGNTLNKLF